MKVTMWCRWFVALSFVSLSAFVGGAPPADSQSLAGSESMGSDPGGNQDTLTPTKPKGANADGGIRSIRPPERPGQAPVPRKRAEALEKRLRNGQMERPVAQGQISDRLEQLHRGSAESSPGDTTTEQTAQ